MDSLSWMGAPELRSRSRQLMTNRCYLISLRNAMSALLVARSLQCCHTFLP